MDIPERRRVMRLGGLGSDRFIRITSIAFLGVMLNVYAFSQGDSESSQVRDPILTNQILEDAPFMRPEITLQKALRIAESSLRKSFGLDRYFLQEAKLSYSREATKEPYWYFKWVRWGVRQSENVPVEIGVSMKGEASFLHSARK